MPVTTIEGHEIHVDDEGFMTVYEEWDETLGAALAGAIGVDMSDEPGTRSASCARTSRTQDETPTLRRVSTAGGFETKKLFALFPKKPAKKMAYIAGLPKPKGCV